MISDTPPSPGGALVLPGLLPPATRLWIIADGRAGHEAQTLALAEALGPPPEIKRIAPGKLFAALAPFGPVDPFDRKIIAPPFPDIALAAGRRTIPYLRRIKAASGRKTFTIYVNRPATGRRTADLIIAPRHDGMFGPTVIAPLTPPNRVTSTLLGRLRATVDPRIALLPRPRCAVLVGGDSRHFSYGAGEARELDYIVSSLLESGKSVMATASRRTPEECRKVLREACAESPRGFFWDGDGDNPYHSMLANADHIIVTADSVNMVGEAVATGAPVQVFAPLGGHRKIAVYLSALEAAGAVRPWRGALEDWRPAPIQSTPAVARAVVKAYGIFKGVDFLQESCGAADND